MKTSEEEMPQHRDELSHLRARCGAHGPFFGADYNPEQWPREVHAEDLELMGRAHIDFVTVGVFSWARLEPGPGRVDLEWVDSVLDDLDSQALRVDLALPDAPPAPGLRVRHP